MNELRGVGTQMDKCGK